MASLIPHSHSQPKSHTLKDGGKDLLQLTTTHFILILIQFIHTLGGRKYLAYLTPSHVQNSSLTVL